MALNPNPSAKAPGQATSTPGAPESGSPRWITIALEVGIVLVALALFGLIRLAWLETAIVTSGSMEPTLRIGDRVLVDHRASLAGTWAHGDIVLFDAPAGWSGEGETLIKRVAGVPGEVVAMQNGVALVNGTPLSEPYLPQVEPPSDVEPQMVNLPPRTLGPGEYWVLGDNRWNSDDSRSNGPLPSAAIRGRILRVLLSKR